MGCGETGFADGRILSFATLSLATTTWEEFVANGSSDSFAIFFSAAVSFFLDEASTTGWSERILGADAG